MKSTCLAIAWALAAAVLAIGAPARAADACQGHPSGNKLTVQVTGVRAPRGEMAITVYPDDPARFLAPHGKLLRVRAPIQGAVTTACFWVPAAGFYEVAVYHDENADGHFDRALSGLPTEGFGFSNNPPTPMALPPFRATRVAVNGETRTTVRLRYAR